MFFKILLYFTLILPRAQQLSFPVMLFIMPHKVVLAYESVGEILKCIQMKAAYQYFSRGAVYYAVEGGSNLTLWGKS